MRLIDADQAVSEAERLLEVYNFAMAGAETNREINHVFKRQELFKAVRAVVNTCPTQDPTQHGRWIQSSGTEYLEVSCSECGYKVNYFWSGWQDALYCPKCGARMDGDKNEF